MQPWPSKFNPDTTRVNCALNVYFETAFNSARAWSIWSNAYVTIAAVVIVPARGQHVGPAQGARPAEGAWRGDR
jgi:hypothetical protein